MKKNFYNIMCIGILGILDRGKYFEWNPIFENSW